MVASVGVNLGFAYLSGARDLIPTEIDAVNADDRAAILWLDRFVMNPDRTERNTNLMWWSNRIWLIDHGAALGFQYDWPSVTETSTRNQSVEMDPHLFSTAVSADAMREWDDVFAARLTRDVLDTAVGEVPDEFLEFGDADSRMRRRAAYSAFLWKRLKPPRAFAEVGVAPSPRAPRRGPPAWLLRR